MVLFWMCVTANNIAPVHCLTLNNIKQAVREQVQKKHFNTRPTSLSPLTNTVLFLPSDYVSDSVVYVQRATNSRLEGYTNLKNACLLWEEEFQTASEDGDNDIDDFYGNGVQMNLKRISLLSSTTFVVQWNVTWVPPTALWLQSLAKANRWTPDYCSYVHLSDQISTFSYKAIAKLFRDAFAIKQLRIPLACIEGKTTCTFSSSNNSNNDLMVVESIVEDLAFAQDLRRGSLQNRKCAQDLRLFLECGRRILPDDTNTGNNDWDDVVAVALPWSSVPGMSSPLEVEPNDSEEAMVPVIFVIVSALIVLGFASAIAPELIGQSLFGPPSYIVSPDDLKYTY